MFPSTTVCSFANKNVIFSHNSYSEYLEDNGKTYLRVVALHEMGNLQFYHENRQLVFGGTYSLFHINTAKVETLQEFYHIPQI